MSVSRNSDVPVDGFDDLEIQSNTFQIQVGTGDLTGGTPDSYDVSDEYSFAPAGGLARDEVAELVALNVNSFGAYILEKGAAGTTPSTIIAENSITIGQQQESSAGGQITGLGGGATAIFYGRDENPGKLWHGSTFDSVPFNDTTNNVGGGGGGFTVTNEWHNFHQEFGAGPVVDRHDEIYNHGLVEARDLTNQAFRSVLRYQMFWNVMDQSEARDAGLYF